MAHDPWPHEPRPQEVWSLALSKRGKIVAGIAGVVVLGLIGVGVYAAVTGTSPVDIARAIPGVPDPPPTCPLTGEQAPGGQVPDRPVAAVKVENTSDALPQVGLDKADIVYEELVEGGITRFIVLFQCQDAPRVGPVRSARTTDPNVLLQYDRAILAYSGGTNKVQKLVNRSGLYAFNETTGGNAFERDPNRAEPHNLFVSVPKLRKVAGHKARKQGPPDAAFSYGDIAGKSKKATHLAMTFSTLNSVAWDWSRREGAWVRSDNGQPNVLEDGTPVQADNVVVQYVKVTTGDIQDVTGSPSPEVTLTGSGKAYIFRDGRVVPGKWQRGSIDQPTRFTTKDGDAVLTPGRTWVELYPAKGGFAHASIDFGK
jgi:Protein of unknown function (DUF3048) N-terminal domain/Protein of unknown function (DUF3048) C-terminal domain